MGRTLAAIALILGILTVAFALSSFFHLRQLAFGAAPEDLLDHFDFRVLAVGMHDESSTNVMVAADVARQLQTRVYTVFGVGLVLLLTGGAILLQPRQSQYEQNVVHGVAGSA